MPNNSYIPTFLCFKISMWCLSWVVWVVLHGVRVLCEDLVCLVPNGPGIFYLSSSHEVPNILTPVFTCFMRLKYFFIINLFGSLWTWYFFLEPFHTRCQTISYHEVFGGRGFSPKFIGNLIEKIHFIWMDLPSGNNFINNNSQIFILLKQGLIECWYNHVFC